MDLSAYYSRLPVLAQHGAVTVYGAYWYWRRFGPGFGQYARAFRERDRWSRNQWHVWQQARLREVLAVAADRVPYYQQTWSSAEKAAARRGDLARLPLLAKEPLRRDPFAFVASTVKPRTLMCCYTSGSTGTPISVFWSTSELRQSQALREVRSAGWAGVSFRQPRATFSGRMVEPDVESPGPFYRYNAVERQVYFSPFHLGADTAEQYVTALRRHRTTWLTGYAVSNYLLADLMQERGLAPVPTLKAVVTTSEKVTREMREVMQRAFACRVFEEYSTVDNVLFASECEEGQLHVSPDVGVVEILRPDGTPCPPGEAGEVVSTGLMRASQPFVRFRLGDVAMWSDEACACGRAMPVLREVCGRVEDVIVGPDGRQMVRFHGVFVDQPRVREGQIVQDALDLIRVNIVPAEGFSAADEASLVSRVRQRLGPGVRVVVHPLSSIPRTAEGKFQAVISHVPRPSALAPES